MAISQLHVWISGRVQGVSFRYHAQEQALRLNVRGWIRNLYDGRVETVFCGTDNDVAQMLAWCRKGSPAARVDRLEISEESPEDFPDFQIRITARGG